MTNALFHGTQGMQVVANTATIQYAVETGMASYLSLISQVGNNPSPQQMGELAQAYQFFSGMWNGTSGNINGVTVDFRHMKGDPAKIQSDLQNLHTKIEKLFTSCDNIQLPSPSGRTMQLTDENGKPLTLLDLVTGRPDDPKFQICAQDTTAGNQQPCDWYDGNFDDTTYHNDRWHGANSESITGDFDPSKMPPGFSCHFDTYSSGACQAHNHTSFTITIDPKAVASAAESYCGVSKGETGLEWLQQHCSVTPSDPAASAQNLSDFNDSFDQFMSDAE